MRVTPEGQIAICSLREFVLQGICLCVWRLVRDAPSGVYLVLEFLDGTFNFGQGVVLFIIFGLDGDLILDPARRLGVELNKREFTDRKVRGSNPTSASRLLLSRLGQPGSIPALVQPSGGMAIRN
ncbi:hypothetical protein T265_05653 [Opisthorchis viverrini]|uniref:Uncharacterized protein n=1 Tax=Opisthorchis viverrini TaxID=6198 RepID=A0A075AF06_OPIVI|nr:hypothetical protein T265_05653 [Opisthorchis viverrini]KER27249.1 hypothetical protein T265_05653 [Opisthorchis viverrini]